MICSSIRCSEAFFKMNWSTRAWIANSMFSQIESNKYTILNCALECKRLTMIWCMCLQASPLCVMDDRTYRAYLDVDNLAWSTQRTPHILCRNYILRWLHNYLCRLHFYVYMGMCVCVRVQIILRLWSLHTHTTRLIRAASERWTAGPL